jgi:hypothetical protein
MDKEKKVNSSDKTKEDITPQIILMPQEDIDNLDPETSTLSDAIEAVKAGETAPEEELDIPGSELDDDAEETGSEDEENNYYSIGGDEHDNLEEDNAG